MLDEYSNRCRISLGLMLASAGTFLNMHATTGLIASSPGLTGNERESVSSIKYNHNHPGLRSTVS